MLDYLPIRMIKETQEVRERRVIKLFIFAGIVILILTVFNFYRQGRISFFGDIDHEYLNAFSSFLGGTIGILLSTAATYLVWMTLKTQREDIREVREMAQKQINLSLKPDIYMLNEVVSGHLTQGSDGKYYPWNISSEPFNLDSQNIEFRLVNVGFGAAKKVFYKWEFDIRELANYINERLPNKFITVESENVLKVNLNEMAGGYFLSSPYLTENHIDIILSGQGAGSFTKIRAPYIFFFCYYLAIYLMLNQQEKKPDMEKFSINFPKCHLRLTYLDVADNQHTKRYYINMEGALGAVVHMSEVIPAFKGTISFSEEIGENIKLHNNA